MKHQLDGPFWTFFFLFVPGNLEQGLQKGPNGCGLQVSKIPKGWCRRLVLQCLGGLGLVARLHMVRRKGFEMAINFGCRWAKAPGKEAGLMG